MSDKKIKYLLEKFYTGETTIAEEKELTSYFSNTSSVDESLLADRELFNQVALDGIEFPESIKKSLELTIDSFDNEKNSNGRAISVLMYSMAIACSLIIGMFIYLPKANSVPVMQITQTDTYNNPDEAYAEAKKALLFISSKMNKGSKQLSRLKKMEAPKQELEYNTTKEELCAN